MQADLWVQALWDSRRVERSSQRRVRALVVPAVADQNSDSHLPLLIFGLGIGTRQPNPPLHAAGLQIQELPVARLQDTGGTRSTSIQGSCTPTHGAAHPQQLLPLEASEPHRGPFGRCPETCPPRKTILAKGNVSNLSQENSLVA